MGYRTSLLITILRKISFPWTFFLVIGLLEIPSLAENSVNQTGEIDSIIRSSSNNETSQNESSLITHVTEKQTRMPHKLEYYSIKREPPHQKWNNTDSQNHSSGSEVLPLKNADKINFSKKPMLKNSGWLYNDRTLFQGKREAFKRMRKSSNSETQQYDAQAYKDYYQQQHQQQEQPRPEYVDGYNTIQPHVYSDDYRDYGNIAEEQDIKKWQNYHPSGGGSSSCCCSSYKQAYTCQSNCNCDSPASTFLSTLGMLVTNLWQLIQLMATSAIPFVIPILALKIILVPIKILKFLQLIKFFFKLFIVLPFLIRVFYPMISNGFGLQNWFYSKPSHVDHHYNYKEGREEKNATGNWHSDLGEYIQHYSNISGDRLRQTCSSKAACELGSFLSTSTMTKFPEKLTKYLVKKAEEAEEAEETSNKDDSLESEKENAIRAFMIAIGKKWSMEQCAVYTCSVIL